MAEKKPIPKKPEPLILSEDEDDNLFFALSADDDMGNEAWVELSMVCDVKGDGDDESMEYLYSTYLELDYLKELQKWLAKAIKFMEHVEEYGAPIPLILGVEDDDDCVEDF